MSDPDKQVENMPKRDEKGRLLPGNTANPNGRPKGKSLKEFWKQRFSDMTEDEKKEFSRKVSPELLWQMAEGRPSQATDLTSNGEQIIPIFNGLSRGDNVQEHNSDQKDIQTQQTN